MTSCTTCVSVAALLFQFVSHVVPNTQVKHEQRLGWWQIGSTDISKGSSVPTLHTLALVADIVAIFLWCVYSIDECRPDRRLSDSAKLISRVFGAESAFFKGCGCCFHMYNPQPGMIWCCVFSAISLLFTLFSLCTAATDDYEPRQKHHYDHSYFA